MALSRIKECSSDPVNRRNLCLISQSPCAWKCRGQAGSLPVRNTIEWCPDVDDQPRAQPRIARRADPAGGMRRQRSGACHNLFFIHRNHSVQRRTGIPPRKGSDFDFALWSSNAHADENLMSAARKKVFVARRRMCGQTPNPLPSSLDNNSSAETPCRSDLANWSWQPTGGALYCATRR